MVDGTRHDGPPEDDSLEPADGEGFEAIEELVAQLESEGVEIMSRAPIAAVSVGKSVGKVSQTSLVVVCSDGSCFQLRQRGGEWDELEPVPGTERALQLATEPKKMCGVTREGAADESLTRCIEPPDHAPPHIDASGFKW